MSAINWNATVKAAQRLHATAKDGVTTINKVRYTFAFDRYQGHYVVTDAAGEEVTRLNTRKITEAKRWLREWLAN